MAGVKEVGELYELILLSPGLNERIKLDSRITCRAALQLVMALEYGLSSKEAANPLARMVNEDDVAALRALAEDVLAKANLKEFYEKLRKLG